MQGFSDFIRNKDVKKDTKEKIEEKKTMIKNNPNKGRSMKRNVDFAEEAEIMIENLKRKIDGVFYRFGVSGLEKLDQVMIESINEMISPEKRATIKESRRIPMKEPKRNTSKTSVAKPAEDTLDMVSAILDAVPKGPVTHISQPTSDEDTENDGDQIIIPSTSPRKKKEQNVSENELDIIGQALLKC